MATREQRSLVIHDVSLVLPKKVQEMGEEDWCEFVQWARHGARSEESFLYGDPDNHQGRLGIEYRLGRTAEEIPFEVVVETQHMIHRVFGE